jgi:autotransporter-associated beta strand protein
MMVSSHPTTRLTRRFMRGIGRFGVLSLLSFAATQLNAQTVTILGGSLSQEANYGVAGISGSTLYVNSGNQVFGLPVTGGNPTTSFSVANLSYLTISGSTFYGLTAGTASDTVFSIPVAGGAPTTRATISATSAAPYDLLVSGSTIYVSASSPDRSNPNNYGDGIIMSLPVTGGSPKTLSTFTGSDGTYSGGTFVEAGTLEIRTAAALPTGTSLTVGANASSVFGASVPQTASPVPEPSTLLLLSVAGITAAAAVWRRRRN